MSERYKIMNGFLLKLIALTTMLIDHVGAVLFPGVMLYRYIGRIAFPIYVFLLVEGFYHTRNIRKYELRLLIFAFLSEIPFDRAFHNSCFYVKYQNVFFTLFLGLLTLHLLKMIQNTRYRRILTAVIVVGIMTAAYLMHTDYDAGGVLLIFLFDLFRNKPVHKAVSLGIVSLVVFGPIECFSLLAMIPILLYNGKQGFGFMQNLYKKPENRIYKNMLKLSFYIFYPAHLFILHFLHTHTLL